MRLLVSVFPWLALWSLTTNASQTDYFTLKQLVERAITQNSELKALDFEVEALKASTDQAGRLSNPNIDLGFARKTEREGDTQFSKVGLSQSLDWPGRVKARIRAMENQTTSARLDQSITEAELRAKVLTQIYAFKISEEKANHAKERLERFKTIGEFLNSRVFASPQKRAEVSIVRAKLLVLSKEQRELATKKEVAWNQLNLYLGLASPPKLRVKWFKDVPDLPESVWAAKIELQNPDLRRQNQSLLAAQNEMDLLRRDAFPGFTVSANFENGSGANPEKIYGLGLSVPIPLFDAKGSAIQGQKMVLQAEAERKKWVFANANQELQSALIHYRAARNTLGELSFDEIKKLESDMNRIDRDFKKGQVDLLTYIEADAEHVESLNAIFDAQVEFIEAQNSIYLLVGEAPPVLE